MYIEKGAFTIDDIETVELEGHYDISSMINELAINKPDIYEDENIPCQSVCLKANVLCRTDTENLTELIKVLMRYTHDRCDDLDLDKSVESAKVMMGGTICPRKRVLFVYKSKVFVTYGRYIFGYDQLYVKIHRVSSVSDTSGSKNNGSNTSVSKADIEDADVDSCSSNTDSDNDVDTGGSKSSTTQDDDSCCSDESDSYSEKRLDDKITKSDIVLNAPPYDKNCDDYVYSFMIYDKNSNVLDAFGLYR